MIFFQKLFFLLLLPLAVVPHARAVVVRDNRALKNWKPKKVGRGALKGAGAPIVEGEDAMLGKKEATCSESFPAPERGSRVCPSQCRFMRYDPHLVCRYRCVTEAQCVSNPDMPSSIADLESGMCTLCKVSGCEKCAASANKCLTCKAGFDFIEGACLPHSRWGWRIVYAVLGVLLVAVLVWLIQLAWRPVVNQEALDAAVLHRSLSKTLHDEERRRPYPLHTNVCTEFIPEGGTGVLLHFRFEHAALHWTFFVAVVMGCVALMHNRFQVVEVVQLAPSHEEVYESCMALDVEDQADLNTMRMHFLYATAFVYVASFVGVLLFAISQRRTFVETDARAATMNDFALFCSGFPHETWGPVEPQEGEVGLEDEYTQFFRDSPWGDSVLGVSIAWDMKENEEDVYAVLDDAIARMEADHRGDKHIEARPSPPRSCPCLPDVEGQLLGVKQAERLEGEKVRTKSDEESTPQSWRGPAAVKGFTDMQTTGGIFVIFHTQDDMLRALETPLPKFRGTHDICIRHMGCEPATILWDGFSVTHTQRLFQFAKGICELIVLMVAWAVFFWGPYTYYVLSWTKVAGSTKVMEGLTGMIQTTVLGLLITVGNQMVYTACGSIARRCRFTTTDSRDKLSVSLYTFAVSLNIFLDLALLTYMAHGFQQDSGMDEEALVRNPSMQHALFVQLVAYIYPGTILLPFLLEPLAMCFVNFYIFSWLIRSRPDVTKLQAEKCLECAPFDLNRYGDIIVNMVLCNLIFFLTSVKIWWMFAQLVTSCVVICAWDQYRFLRECKRTEFATNKMDVCAQYLTIFPCAVLAGGLAFKYQGGQAMVKGWGRDTFLHERSEWLYVAEAMLAHVVVHSLLLYFVVPLFVRQVDPQPCTYVEVAEKSSCNWFNANPVHCMRSLHYYCHDPPHIIDLPGRAHLHKVNHDIHAYYEAPDFEEEESFLSQVFSKASESFEEAKIMMHDAKLRVASFPHRAKEEVARVSNETIARVASFPRNASEAMRSSTGSSPASTSRSSRAG
eukprot:CAMPEP_0115171142 /NCGR_PEP_ID=MMETSP0270-20121206/2152_1 /TAXON_ID=71861 /ORGANISM="Scrippsiella trochoidea, Strain CCMP3099" /LENGTH=1013 /DNA_ID=CAMNT_0002583903 /DNA_START=15 /DNA_END=3056 /DNA_ORIENTATION=+